MCSTKHRVSAAWYERALLSAPLTSAAWVFPRHTFLPRGPFTIRMCLSTSVTPGRVSVSENRCWASACGTFSAASITSNRGPMWTRAGSSGWVSGARALAVLLSAVLDGRLHSVLFDRPIATYRSIVESKAYSLDLTWFLFDVLKHFDLPDLTALLAPRPCWLLNATSAQGESLAESEVSSLYRNAAEAFKRLGAGEQIRFVVRPEQESEKVFQEWLGTA